MSAPLAVTRTAWTVKRALINLRWAGLVGLGLVLFTAALSVVSIQSARQHLHALNDEAANLSSRLGQRGTASSLVSGRSRLSNFYAFFPLTHDVPELLGRIYRAGIRNQVVLAKGEYKLTREADFPLVRYQITLPVSGDYARVRGFVNDVLEAVPSAALEELTLKRESIDQPELEARVRLSVFLGAE
jgi:Tfp pilus assembly protein PilO